MGWSAGAALAVLAGTRQENKERLEGVAAVSLPKEGELGWHWTDAFSFLPFLKWRGPFFSCLGYVPKVAPLPLLLIHSSGDRWVPDEDQEELFQVAIRPRRRVLLHAGGHSFPGARAQFFEELHYGLSWMKSQARQ
jgi:dienelactone hydrolase